MRIGDRWLTKPNEALEAKMPHQMGIAESCGMWVPVVRLQRCCLDLCLSDIAAQKTNQSEGVASLYEPKHLLNLVDVFQVRPER